MSTPIGHLVNMSPLSAEEKSSSLSDEDSSLQNRRNYPSPSSSTSKSFLFDKPIKERGEHDEFMAGHREQSKTGTHASIFEEEKETESISLDQSVAIWKDNLMNTCPVRRAHHQLLLNSLDACTNDETSSLLLITGPSGIGKTHLAESLRDAVEASGGYFLTGKFNQQQQLEPFIAFVAAFTEFTNAVMKKGHQVVDRTKEAVLRAVGDDKEVLTGMIPALEQLIGKNEHSEHNQSKSSSTDTAVRRFVFVFRMFLRAVSTPKRPIVLLLDDLHWADPCSLDLLASILMEMKHRGLMIVATCDSNVAPDSYLSQKLREIEDGSLVLIANMTIPNTDPSGVEQALSHILRRSLEDCNGLAKIVSTQTDGKPFFMSEFLRWLEHSGFLYLDRRSNIWAWNEDDIQASLDTVQRGQFLVDRLERLPSEMKDILKVTSCLGIQVEKTVLEYALGRSINGTMSQMQGVLHYNELRGLLTFSHDEFMHSSYQLVPNGERARFHLEIGSRIWKALDQDGVDRYIFVILSQLAHARQIITRNHERISTAFLCLQAGRKAAKASAFGTAAFYLTFGIELVGDSGWNVEYYLTLALYNAGAEMEMINCNYDRVESLVEVVISHARNDLDRIQAYVTQILRLANINRQMESVDLGIQVLAKFGEHFPARLCNARLIAEIRSVRRLLKDKSDEQILRIPDIEDDRKLACFQVMNQMFLSALFARPKVYFFIALKAVKLTMTYGLSNFAASAFATYGMCCISALGNIDEGYRFGELALKLLDKFGSVEHLPRVYAAHFGVIHVWKRPLRDSLSPLWKAAQVGAQTGDIEFSSLCANSYLVMACAASENLQDWLTSWKDLERTLISRRQETFLQMCRNHVQCIHHFVGLTDDPLSPQGDLVDFDQVVKLQPPSTMRTFNVYACRMWVAYVFNDYELAGRMAALIHKDAVLSSVPPTMGATDVVFYSGMVALANARLGRDRRRNIGTANRCLKRLRKWAEGAPVNFIHKKFLLQAELASVCEQKSRAMEKYICAIAMSHEFGYTLEHALANERVAQHLVRIGTTACAEPYFRQACLSYEQWGGIGKIRHLQTEINALYRCP